MHFVCLIFPDFLIFFSQSLTGDFSNIELTFSIWMLNVECWTNFTQLFNVLFCLCLQFTRWLTDVVYNVLFCLCLQVTRWLGDVVFKVLFTLCWQVTHWLPTADRILRHLTMTMIVTVVTVLWAIRGAGGTARVIWVIWTGTTCLETIQDAVTLKGWSGETGAIRIRATTTLTSQPPWNSDHLTSNFRSLEVVDRVSET